MRSTAAAGRIEASSALAARLNSGEAGRPAVPAMAFACDVGDEAQVQALVAAAEERFGPIGFVIRTVDADDALLQATTDARRGGAITAFLYSSDERYIARAEDGFSASGAQLTVNLTGPMPLNFAAAYSDYHVTGLNPAGNATLMNAWLGITASAFLSLAYWPRP